jgi:hypothetical protein
VHKMHSAIKKIFKLLSRYPDEAGVSPKSFDGMRRQTSSMPVTTVLAFQSVPDKFYFLLFGAIKMQLDIYVGNKAEGTGWLAELKRSSIISWLWSGPWVRAYSYLTSGVAYRCATWMHPVGDLMDWIRSKSLWFNLQEQGEDFSLCINGIEIADLLIDSYLRFKPSPKFNVRDQFVRRLIWQALRDIRQASAYFGKVKPQWYLTSYSTYLEHGIPVRVAMRYGVQVWSFASLKHLGKKLSLTDSYHTDNFSGYRADFDVLDQQEERLEAARVQLEKRLSGAIDDATSYMRKSAYAQSDVQLPANLNDAVVIFLHDFYDSPHVYPDLIFRDFWHWVCFSIDVFRKSNIKFFLKPHPNQIALSDEALGILGQKYPDLQWLPAATSNVDLARAGIACGITMYGTVANELAYLGVPSICCARHPHHTFDFCRTARTRDEYGRLLKTYNRLNLSKEEMKRQALAFYYMHNLYGTEEEREMRQAIGTFWRACNVGMPTEEGVMRSLHALINLPAFDRFVTNLAQDKELLGINREVEQMGLGDA